MERSGTLGNRINRRGALKERKRRATPNRPSNTEIADSPWLAFRADSTAPSQLRRVYNLYPGFRYAPPWASMKPMLSRPTAKKKSLPRLLVLFISRSGNNPPFGPALVLDRYGARHEHRSDQAPKSVTLLARSVSGSSEQRNKWQGPASGGKDAVYAGWELEPM